VNLINVSPLEHTAAIVPVGDGWQGLKAIGCAAWVGGFRLHGGVFSMAFFGDIFNICPLFLQE
jgi:hypothetical protein